MLFRSLTVANATAISGYYRKCVNRYIGNGSTCADTTCRTGTAHRITAVYRWTHNGITTLNGIGVGSAGTNGKVLTVANATAVNGYYRKCINRYIGNGSTCTDATCRTGTVHRITAIYRGTHNGTTALNGIGVGDRKSTRLNSSHIPLSRMPSSA